MAYKTAVLKMENVISQLKNDPVYLEYKDIRIYPAWQNSKWLRLDIVENGIKRSECIGNDPRNVHKALQRVEKSRRAKMIEKKIAELTRLLNDLEIDYQRERYFCGLVERIQSDPLISLDSI